MAAPVQLGAPGVYLAAPEAIRALTGVRMDVCAFAGVAPRGPARVPVTNEQWTQDRSCVDPDRPLRHSVPIAVESFEQYRRIFGGFEGPGLLPYAVASFFEQGGKRAYVVRVVHAYGDDRDAQGVAAGALPGLVREGGGAPAVRARNEGSWGNKLRVTAERRIRPGFATEVSFDELRFPADTDLAAGSLVRITVGRTGVLRFVVATRVEPLPKARGYALHATLDRPLAALPDPDLPIEILEVTLTIDPGDGFVETHVGLGLAPEHPRWLGRVLCRESELVYPGAAWMDVRLLPSEELLRGERVESAPFHAVEDPLRAVEDRWQHIVPDDFFDPRWVPGDEEPGRGVHALVDLDDLSMLVVPDLYSPGELVPREDIRDPASLAGPVFSTCLPAEPRGEQEPPAPGLDGLRLDPRDRADLAVIEGLQLRLLELAEQLRSFVVLLDVPPRLRQRQVLAWRAKLRSPWAAAYHPWLLVARPDDARDALIRVNPSAAAAGIVAEREARFGVPYGPANAIAAGVVGLDDELSPAQHDELHQNAVNVYVRERDGVLLSAARTLSPERDYRQLSVRRLITMLERTVAQQCQWMVFEPNNEALRAEVRRLLTGLLGRLFRANAFAGANEDEAFFVRCDDVLNDQRVLDAGRLIAEIGVAPAEPLEFIVLHLDRRADGTLTVEA